MGNSSEPKNNITGFANELSDLLLNTDDKNKDLIPSCIELISKIAETSIESDWPSLNDICLLFQERLNAVVEKGEQLNVEQLDALKLWPSLVLDLVNSTSTQEPGSALVNHLNNPCWNSRLSDMDVEILKTMLSMPVAGDEAALSSEPEAKETTKAPVVTAGPDGKLPEAVRELVELLTAGLNDIENLLQATFEKAAVKNIKPEEKTALLETLAQQLASYSEASSSIGFKALEQICLHVQANILQLVEQGVTPEITKLFEEWITQVRSYLNVVTDADTAANLAVFMVDDAWPLPFPIEQAEALSMQLVAPEIPELEAESPKRKQQASDEDVSLELPDDVDQDLLEALLQELPGQTEEFSTAIQNLINGGTLEDINVAQRVTHTLKGAGNTVGIRGMANIAHNLEDILLALAKHQTLPPEPLVEMMQNASDCLEAISEGLAGLGELPDNAREVLQDILDWANQIDREGIPADAKAPAREKAETEKTSDKKEAAGDQSSAKKDSGKVPVPMIRISATLVDELLRLEGEEVIFSGQIQERLRRITGQSRDIQDQYLRLQELGGKLEELIDVKDMGTVANQVFNNAEFDALEMDQYSELHTCTRLLVETATDIHEMGKSVISQLTSLEEMVVGQERLNRESQEVALRTRMVPVDTIFSRLQRAVRQTCNATKKKVNLKLQGGETLVASDVLNDLVDPLMHIVRNAIDHGIENADIRQQRGKPEQGEINLEFLREGNQIVVKVQDDGGGLDLEGIKRTAKERGLLESEDITDTQLIKFILRPNFSTRTETTQISGRGIGMDAVNTRIIELGGTLTLNTEEGKGCLVEFSLPISLISMHALLVRVGRNIISIANRGVEQILHADDGKVTQNGEGQLFQVGETKYPLKSLEVLLNIHDRRSKDRNARPVILIKTQDGITAVMVESVVDSRDVVVKGLGQYIPKLHGVMGATILGDGSVTPVIDLPELLRDPVKRSLDTDDLNATSEFILNLPLALVVDDSLSARRSLTQFMEDSGFEVRAARDGIEAIEILEGRKPNIMLVDMEMPRMNGIELTAHVRSHDKTMDIPIIMITSRSTAKHRQQAESAGVNSHITKPFNEEELLEEVERIRLRD